MYPEAAAALDGVQEGGKEGKAVVVKLVFLARSRLAKKEVGCPGGLSPGGWGEVGGPVMTTMREKEGLSLLP